MSETTEEVLKPEMLGGLRVYSAGDLQRPERALIYGTPSSGKTPLLGSAVGVEPFDPMLIIDCDDGPKSLRHRYPQAKLVSPRTLKQLQSVVDALRTGKWQNYKSIAVDGVSTVQFRGFEHLYGQDGRYRSFTEFESPKFSNGGWQASANQMAIMVEAFKSIPVHLFFTAWAKDVSKPTRANPDPVPMWEPAFSPAVSDRIAGAFDSILFMHSKEVKGENVRILQSKATRAMARDRDERLPASIENPTMEILAKHWGLL